MGQIQSMIMRYAANDFVWWKRVPVLDFSVVVLCATTCSQGRANPQPNVPSSVIEVEGGGEYFYQERHPTRFDWDTFTFCAGRTARVDSAALDNVRVRAEEASGERTVFLRTPGVLGQVLNQHVRWQSIFDRENYVFSVVFHKRVGQRVTTAQQRQPCNTKSWTYRIDRASARAEMKVAVQVPPNVWMVQVLPRGNRPPGTVFEIRRVASIPAEAARSPAFVAEEGIRLEENGPIHFFVNPSSQIEISAKVNSNLRDVSVVADFEITYVSFNRCDRILSDFRALQGVGGGAPVTAALLRGSLDHAATALGNPSPAGLNRVRNTMMTLGCLTSQDHLANIIYENSLSEVGEILAAIDSFREGQGAGRSVPESDFGPPAPPSPEDEAARHGIRASLGPLSVLINMAGFSVAQATKSTLGMYCERHPIFEPGSDRIVGTRTAFDLLRLRVQRIGMLIGLIESADGLIQTPDKMFGAMLEALSEIQASTEHRDVIRERYFDRLVRLEEDWRQAQLELRMSRAYENFVTLPPFQPTRQLVEFERHLGAASRLTGWLDEAIFLQIDNILEFRQESVTLSEIRSKVQELGAVMADLRVAYRRLASAVGQGGPAPQRTVNELGDTIEATGFWLNNAFRQFLAPFVQMQQQRFPSNLSQEELSACASQTVRRN